MSKINTKRFNAGMIAKKNGEHFENVFIKKCYLEEVACVKIPEGCKRYKSNNGRLMLKPIKSPFDFFITKNKSSACLDVKTVKGRRFPFSKINQNQITELLKTSASIPSGYLVWFREIDSIIFYSAKILSEIKKGSGVGDSDGLYIGSINYFKINLLF